MFTYNIQYGGDPHDKYHDKGPVNYEQFIKAVDTFPWSEEIDKANANPDGCAPTLSAKNLSDQRDLWISAAGDRMDYEFLVGYNFPKIKRSFFGFGKEKIVEDMDIITTKEQSVVRELFRHFFNRNYEELHNRIKGL